MEIVGGEGLCRLAGILRGGLRVDFRVGYGFRSLPRVQPEI